MNAHTQHHQFLVSSACLAMTRPTRRMFKGSPYLSQLRLAIMKESNNKQPKKETRVLSHHKNWATIKKANPSFLRKTFAATTKIVNIETSHRNISQNAVRVSQIPSYDDISYQLKPRSRREACLSHPSWRDCNRYLPQPLAGPWGTSIKRT